MIMQKFCSFSAIVATAILLASPVLAQQVSGTVKWYNATKGFGFIQPDAGGPDVFVHISAVERAGLATLEEGQKVNYEVFENPPGKRQAQKLSLPK
jgi:CspA family cold shock protein